MSRLRSSVWAQRADFTFDAHVEPLVQLFRQCITARSRDGDQTAPGVTLADSWR